MSGLRWRRWAPLAVLLLGGLVLPACADHPAMTAADARVFTERALKHAGLAKVTVVPEVVGGKFRSTDSRFRNEPPVEVFSTRSFATRSSGVTGEVELLVPRRGDRAVYVRDTATGGGAFLEEDEFRRLEAFRFSPASDRQSDDRRKAAVAAAALLAIAAINLLWVVVTGAADPRPRRHSRR